MDPYRHANYESAAQAFDADISRNRGQPTTSNTSPHKAAIEPAPRNATTAKRMAATEAARMPVRRGSEPLRNRFRAPMLQNRYSARQVAVDTVLAKLKTPDMLPE